MAITYDVTTKLCWRGNERRSKAITLIYRGDEPVILEVPAPSLQGDGEFLWFPLLNQRLEFRGQSVSISVRPPIPGTGVQKCTNLGLKFYDPIHRQPLPNLDLLIPCCNNCVEKVSFGDLRISKIVFNPPGGDLSGEGEFIEIENLSNHILDLSLCSIRQRVFRAGTAQPQKLVTFTPTPSDLDFGKTCLLASGASLRVLTRKKSNDVPSATRFYLGRPSPVWNNTGDRVDVFNEFGDLLASHGYLSQKDSEANLPVQAEEPQIPTQGPQQVIFRTVFDINAGEDWREVFAQIEDGDTITITTNEDAIIEAFISDDKILPGTAGFFPFSPEYVPSGQKLLILPRRVGGMELSNSTDTGFPIPGAPIGGLVGQLGEVPFVVGDRVQLQATLQQTSALSLCANDNSRWNNRGNYSVTVMIER